MKQECRTIDGVEWAYADLGAGPDVLLVFPGALGAVDATGAVLEALVESRRVVVLAYPAVASSRRFAAARNSEVGWRGMTASCFCAGRY